MDGSPEVESPEPSPAPRPRGKYVARARRKKVASASGWILAIAIMQVLFGVVIGVKSSTEADQAIAHLAQFDADEVVEVDGEEHVLQCRWIS